jgi:FkbM family methyltransferase
LAGEAQPASGRLNWNELLRARSAELSQDLRNWPWVGIAAGLAFPSRIPPRQGLFGRRLGRAQVTLNFRNGYRLRCRLDELEGYYAAFVQREYEGAVADWSAVDMIIDVGANIGAATLWFAGHAPTARVLAVEPGPDVFPRLVANILRSGLQDRVTPVAAAVGAEAGLATVMTERWSVITRTRSGVAPGLPVVGRVSLEQLVEGFGLGRHNVLKLDCEGAEYETLLSAPLAVLANFDAIVAECHLVEGRDISELRSHLQEAGFAVRLADKAGHAGMLTAALRE